MACLAVLKCAASLSPNIEVGLFLHLLIAVSHPEPTVDVPQLIIFFFLNHLIWVEANTHDESLKSVNFANTANCEQRVSSH